MTPARVEVARVVDAPAAVVYRILSDYVDHHPRILPKPEFESLVVEKGGTRRGHGRARRDEGHGRSQRERARSERT